MPTLISSAGLREFFEAVVRESDEQLLADPGRLIALAAAFGSDLLGDIRPVGTAERANEGRRTTFFAACRSWPGVSPTSGFWLRPIP